MHIRRCGYSNMHSSPNAHHLLELSKPLLLLDGLYLGTCSLHCIEMSSGYPFSLLCEADRWQLDTSTTSLLLLVPLQLTISHSAGCCCSAGTHLSLDKIGPALC